MANGALYPPRLLGSSRFRTLLLVLFAIAVVFLVWRMDPDPHIVLDGLFVLDGPGRFVQWMITISIVVATIATVSLKNSISSFFSILMASIAALLWLAAASSMDLAHIALLWASGWVLAAGALATERTPVRLESAVKILGIGMAGSLILILAAALVGGLARSTHILEAGFLLTRFSDSTVLSLATIRILMVGCAIAAGWVPFHLWAPDGLSVAPRPVAVLLAVAAPLCAALTLSRVLYAFAPSLDALEIHWPGGLFAIATLTVVLAGSVALVQNNVARLLAYLTILQSAELLPAVIVAPKNGEAFLLAASAHVWALLPAWLAVAAWSERDESALSFGRLAGEGRRSPLRAILLSVAFALAVGVPGGIRFLSRPEAAMLASPRAAWAIIFALSTILQWAAAVRLIRALFLESRATGQEPLEWPRLSPVWILVGLLLLLEIFFAISGWPPEFDSSWGEMLLGG